MHWTGWPIAPFADSKQDVFCIYLINHFIDDNGGVCLLYTGQGTEGKCGVLARSDDGLLSYTHKKAVLKRYHHDGHVWKRDGLFYTITSKLCRARRSGDLGDAVMLWSSCDLENWTEEGEIFAQKKTSENPEGFMEFPYLLNFANGDVLILGGHPVLYWVGRFDWTLKRFLPDHENGIPLDITNPFHCDNPLCVDDKGRRLIMALYADINYVSNEFLPWKCVHALPRALTLENGRLCQRPVRELEALRRGKIRERLIKLPAGTEKRAPANGDALEIRAEFVSPGVFGVRIAYSQDSNEDVSIWYDAARSKFGVSGGARHTGEGFADLPAGAPVEIRVFIDKQLIEVFVGGQTATTSALALPPRRSEIAVYSEKSDALCTSLQIWTLAPA